MDCTDSTVIQAIMEELEKKDTAAKPTASPPEATDVAENCDEPPRDATPSSGKEKKNAPPLTNRQRLLSLFSNIKRRCSSSGFFGVVKRKVVAWLLFFVVVIVALTPWVQKTILCTCLHFNAADSIVPRLVMSLFATIVYALLTFYL